MSRLLSAGHRYHCLGLRAIPKARKLSVRLYVSMASSGDTLKYKLTYASTLFLQQGDLTRYKGDAIVNAGTF